MRAGEHIALRSNGQGRGFPARGPGFEAYAAEVPHRIKTTIENNTFHTYGTWSVSQLKTVKRAFSFLIFPLRRTPVYLSVYGPS